MSSVSSEELQQVLAIIDKALAMHTTWYDDLLRTLLCKLPMPESVIARDAHQKCEFGCWFYSKGDTKFHDLPSFKNIGELHKTMHDSAREVCMKIKATGVVPEQDYDYFTRCLSQFRNELAVFKERVLLTQDSATL